MVKRRKKTTPAPTWTSTCGRAALFLGDCRTAINTRKQKSVHTCVTSPPYYGLRNYGVDGQIGLEPTPDEYVAEMVKVFREVRRVLRDDGTVWLNLGDSFAGNGGGEQGKTGQRANRRFTASDLPNKVCGGYKPKDLMGIPWRVAFALQADGWWLRQDIIWSKPNPMPESVTDRCTKAHEYIFLLAKSRRYYFDADAIKEPATYAGQNRGGSTNRYEQNAAGMDNVVFDTRNKRSVWHVKPQPFKGAHFATYPPELIRPCILAGAPRGGVVLDPFTGSGTTGEVALMAGRRFVGIELNPDYFSISKRRLTEASVLYDTRLLTDNTTTQPKQIEETLL